MDYVANPFNFWINGQQQVNFTYNPGQNPELWHVRMPEKGVVRFNILMWAQGENVIYEHILAAVALQRKSEIQYQEAHAPRPQNEIASYHAQRNAKWDLIEKHCLEKTMLIALAPTDQVFKVAWAGNDYI